MDRYVNFEELRKSEKAEHFNICQQRGTSGFVIIAPHGGGIEPGTSEIAKGLAGTEHGFYSLEGLKAKRNRDLHITSINFDEPIGVEIVKRSERVVAIHGCDDKRAVIYLGGLDNDLKNEIRRCLVAAGFEVEDPPNLRLKGNHPKNICNRSKNNCGVQVEVSEGLRHLMFENHKTREGRIRTKSTYERLLSALSEAIRQTIE